MSPNDVECKVRHHPLSGTPTRRVSTRAPRLMQETMESQTHAPAWIGASPAMPGNYRLQVTGYRAVSERTCVQSQLISGGVHDWEPPHMFAFKSTSCGEHLLSDVCPLCCCCNKLALYCAHDELVGRVIFCLLCV